MRQHTVLVTGASRGIGAAVAARCMAEGWRVIGVSRNPAPDAAFEQRAIDLAAPGAAEAMRDLARATRPSGLVANAGLVAAGALDAISDADFDATMRLNVQSAIWAVQAVAPMMREAGFGRIVLIGSRAALGKAERGVYGASKAAVAGLARSLALELARDGVTVNCVSPGPIDTGLFAVNQPPGSAGRARIEATIPVGRLGAPGEVAAAVAYFLSPDAGFTTGQTLQVCGGLSVGSP
jgi:NAD(P)-dependent dehydrogenase (short-subunit alcohol dehydrogenase family)